MDMCVEKWMMREAGHGGYSQGWYTAWVLGKGRIPKCRVRSSHCLPGSAPQQPDDWRMNSNLLVLLSRPPALPTLPLSESPEAPLLQLAEQLVSGGTPGHQRITFETNEVFWTCCKTPPSTGNHTTEEKSFNKEPGILPSPKYQECSGVASGGGTPSFQRGMVHVSYSWNPVVGHLLDPSPLSRTLWLAAACRGPLFLPRRTFIVTLGSEDQAFAAPSEILGVSCL